MHYLCSKNLNNVHPSWHRFLGDAISSIDDGYLDALSAKNEWLPGPSKLLNAFSCPFDNIKFILVGESPYPRAASANGYAFWDNQVHEIWSSTGLAKGVNRATSLRNFIKMLLVSEQLLKLDDVSQTAISNLSKKPLVKTLPQLFTGMLARGFLLLNASLVLSSEHSPRVDAKAWKPFVAKILDSVYANNPSVKLILFGKIAEHIKPLASPQCRMLVSEHPYNQSFIENKQVLNFFGPLHLLQDTSAAHE